MSSGLSYQTQAAKPTEMMLFEHLDCGGGMPGAQDLPRFCLGVSELPGTWQQPAARRNNVKGTEDSNGIGCRVAVVIRRQFPWSD